ncbi:diguanylate cyclase [Thiocystis minor]|uniref:diguanylate cyclase n=1 Tax=Thiocystis minor TaxID=61597 RepID=UPI001913B449|nr:diguanylate cyclase [Thiocystis minor]MBK5965437.1 diguanylate cyclase [Thiocystis minor]
MRPLIPLTASLLRAPWMVVALSHAHLLLLLLLVAPIAQAMGPSVALTAEETAYLRGLGPITLAPDPDWAPFEHLDESGNIAGIAIDLVDLVARRLGIDTTPIIARDWDAAVELSKAGNVLILPFLNRTPAREEWLTFTESLLIDPSVFITREEHPFIADATQLSDAIIVLPSGTSIEERIRRDFPNLTILLVPTENDAFQAVSNRAADLTLRSLTVAAYTIRKEGLFNLKIAGQAPEQYVNRLRMGVLKSEPLLRDILNQGIATISAREREEIVNRHVNITIVKPMDYGFILRIAGTLAALIGVSFYWNLRLRKINDALSESERSKSVLIANLPGVAYRCRYDHDWTMEFISAGCLQLTGYRSEDLLHNRVIAYNDLIAPQDRERVWTIWQEARDADRPAALEYRIITADQQEKWVFEQGVFVHDHGKRHVWMIEGLIIDITARKRAEAELYRVSIHDELTGLYNRRYMLERLGALMTEFTREAHCFAIALIDLDYFKKINDTHGHPAGDLVLREFAALLGKSVRPYDLVGRYGGEEFIVVVTDSHQRKIETMLARLRESLKHQVFDFHGTPLSVTFSAGVANSCDLAPDGGIDTLIMQADERLYAAKAQGRDRVVYQGTPSQDA